MKTNKIPSTICLWWKTRDHQHLEMKESNHTHLTNEANRYKRSNQDRDGYLQMTTAGYLNQSIHKLVLSSVMEPMLIKVYISPVRLVREGRSIRSFSHSVLPFIIIEILEVIRFFRSPPSGFIFIWQNYGPIDGWIEWYRCIFALKEVCENLVEEGVDEKSVFWRIGKEQAKWVILWLAKMYRLFVEFNEGSWVTRTW